MAKSASSGAVGGAAGELGSLQRSGVVALIAAHILRGAPLRALGLPAERSIPISVSAETDVPVDDVCVRCENDGQALLQVKTRLTSSTFKDCVKQWVALAQSETLDPQRQRVLACGAEAVSPVKDLQSALERRQRSISGPPTQAEQRALDALLKQLEPLTAQQCELLLDCAGIWLTDLRREATQQEELGVSLLDGHVVQAGHGLAAWNRLRLLGQTLASRRLGADLDEILDYLRKDPSLTLIADAARSRAATRVREREIEQAYRKAVVTQGSCVTFDGVGAGLRPIALADLDMSVNAAPGPPGTDREPGSGYELPWLVRGHHRMLLCGPPGSGKSVALRAAAAHYAARADWPLPLVVDLKRWTQRRRSLGSRDALLDVAFENEPTDSRNELTRLADRMLDCGRAAIFLDSLDETGSARREVVGELRNVLERVDDDVELVLSTRDVGYADARALGFAEFSLVPPGEPEVTSRALLSAAAARDGIGAEHIDEWIEERLRWVEERLSNDRTLRRTPLLIVLVTLLAAEHSREDLPTSRGEILARVIRDVVRRWEADRQRQGEAFTLGPLSGSMATQAAEAAFVEIGRHVLRDDAPAAATVAASLADGLAAHFGLPPGPAKAAAEDAVQFWDTAGVFVKSGAKETLAARVQTLAELAEAQHAIEQLDDVATWVAWAVDAEAGREPLRIATTLSPDVADALFAHAAHDRRWTTLRQCTDALQAGAQPNETAQRSLREALSDEMRTGTSDELRWGAAVTLTTLAVPEASQHTMLEALDCLPAEQRAVARVLAVRGWSRDDPEVKEDLDRIIDARPADLPVLEVAPHPWLRLGPDRNAGLAFEIAVDRLLQPGEDAFAAEIIGKLDERVSMGGRWRVNDLIRDRGFGAALEAAQREQAADEAGSDFDIVESMQRLLKMHAKVQSTLEEALLERVKPAQLTRRQMRELRQAANLLKTLSLGEHRPGDLLYGFSRDPNGLGHIADALAALVTIDMPVAVAQLVEARAIVEDDDRLAVFAIMSAGKEQSLEVAWDDLQDARATVSGLVDVISQGRDWMAWTALLLAADAERILHDEVAALLEARRQTSRGRGLELVTLLWLAVVDTDAAWDSAVADDRAAARRGTIGALSTDGSRPEAVLTRLVGDVDALVREMAVRAAARYGLLERLQSEIEDTRPPSSWECRWCAARNAADASSCERCSVSRS